MNLLYLFKAMPLPVMALSLPLAGVVFMAAAMLYSRFLAGPLGRRPGIPKIWYKLPFLIILVAELVLSYRVWAGVELSPSPVYFLSGGGWSAAVSGEDLKNAQALLKVDAFGAVSAMLMSFVALVAGLRALSDKRNLITPRKAAFFLLTCAGIQGMFYSSGLAVLFVFMMMTQAGVTGLYSNFAVGEKRPGGKHVLYYVSRVVLLAMFLAGAVMLRLEYGTDNITTLASLIKGTPSSLAAFVLMTVPLLYIFFKPSPHLSDASKMCFFGIRTQASLFAAFRVIFSLYGPLDGLQKVPALLVMLGFASMIMAVVFQSGGKSPVHFMDSMIMYIKGMVIVTMGIAVSGTFGAERAALYGVSALESMIGLWLIFLPVAAALSVVTVYLHEVVSGQIAVVLTRIVEVKTFLTLAHPLGHDEHSVICSVENDLAELCVWHEVEIRTSQFEGEHIAYHALVGERGKQRPVVVLAHAHYLDLLFLASLLEWFVQRTERVWFLV